MKAKQRVIPDDQMEELLDKFDTYIETNEREIGAMERHLSDFNRVATEGFSKINNQLGALTKVVSKLSRLDRNGSEIINTSSEIVRIESHTKEIQNNTEVIWEEGATSSEKQRHSDNITQKLLREIRNPLESLSYSFTITAFDKMLEDANERLISSNEELISEGTLVRLDQKTIDALNANKLGIDEWMDLQNKIKENQTEEKNNKASLFEKLTKFLKGRWDAVDRVNLLDKRQKLKDTMFGRMAWGQVTGALDAIKTSMVDMRLLMAWNIITGAIGSMLSFLTSPIGLTAVIGGLGLTFSENMRDMFKDLFGLNGDKNLSEVLANAMVKATKGEIFGDNSSGSGPKWDESGFTRKVETPEEANARLNPDQNLLDAVGNKIIASSHIDRLTKESEAILKFQGETDTKAKYAHLQRLNEIDKLTDAQLAVKSYRSEFERNNEQSPVVPVVKPTQELSSTGDGLGSKQYIEDVKELVLSPLGTQEEIFKILKENSKRGKLSEKEYYKILNDYMETPSEDIESLLKATPGLSEYLQGIQKNMSGSLDDKSGLIRSAEEEAIIAEMEAEFKRNKQASISNQSSAVINNNHTTNQQSSIRPYRDGDSPGIRSYA